MREAAIDGAFPPEASDRAVRLAHLMQPECNSVEAVPYLLKGTLHCFGDRIQGQAPALDCNQHFPKRERLCAACRSQWVITKCECRSPVVVGCGHVLPALKGKRLEQTRRRDVLTFGAVEPWATRPARSSSIDTSWEQK